VKVAKDSEVPKAQSPIVFSQSVCRRDFNQNNRINIQYPEEPMIEPVRRSVRGRRIALKLLRGRMSRAGAHTKEPQSARIGVAALHKVASAMKHKAVSGWAIFLSRTETIIDVACRAPIIPK